MRNTRSWWLAVVASSFLFSACFIPVGGGGSEPTAAELAAVGPGSQPALIIRNASNRTICYVNFSPASSNSWGPDQLGSSETIASGAIRGWRIPANTYDLRVLDCNRSPLADDRGVSVAGNGVVVTYQ